MLDMYGWINRNLKGRKGQQGFTLIELLVVVTILGILAAIVTLSLVGLTTNANAQSCNTEYKTVQAALDAFMAYNNVDQINGASGKDMSVQLLPYLNPVPKTDPSYKSLYNAAPTATNPNFTRNGTTQFTYTWDVNGKITTIGGAPAGCNVT
jgi:prepilin-type N-terminal cleavage/methylation domain-containing protein